jgi:hypothetical protein
LPIAHCKLRRRHLPIAYCAAGICPLPIVPKALPIATWGHRQPNGGVGLSGSTAYHPFYVVIQALGQFFFQKGQKNI